MDDLSFTFGIITDGNQQDRINTILNSIYEENIDNFEVIIVGGEPHDFDKRYLHIPFNETWKPAWITRKKNIITEVATKKHIVYMHDYVCLMPGWYNGWKLFFENNEISDNRIYMNQILNADGTRYRDWTTWDDPTLPKGIWNLPYNDHSRVPHMYASGAYWVATKDIMVKYPLDERRVWGQGEDVFWSKQVFPNPKNEYMCNPLSVVKLLKQKETVAKSLLEDQS